MKQIQTPRQFLAFGVNGDVVFPPLHALVAAHQTTGVFPHIKLRRQSKQAIRPSCTRYMREGKRGDCSFQCTRCRYYASGEPPSDENKTALRSRQPRESVFSSSHALLPTNRTTALETGEPANVDRNDRRRGEWCLLQRWSTYISPTKLLPFDENGDPVCPPLYELVATHNTTAHI